MKGQLIKGGGALASTLGKVIAVKGDAVSNLGKKIVSSAALSEKKPVCEFNFVLLQNLKTREGIILISLMISLP